MNVNALDQMLEEYASARSEVCITLRDGAIVRGPVKDFDGYVVLLAGEPDTMVYRHSILKLMEAAHAVAPEKRILRTRPADQKKRPRQKPDRPEKAEPAEKPGQMGTLGEAMLKWLQSQKGGV